MRDGAVDEAEIGFDVADFWLCGVWKGAKKTVAKKRKSARWGPTWEWTTHIHSFSKPQIQSPSKTHLDFIASFQVHKVQVA
jgi:hypothetical protein